MARFCREFFRDAPHDVDACPQCSAALAENNRFEEALAGTTGPLYSRTDQERAALDCHGQP